MAKEINEKTFELNITNELLNLSKSFIWYLEYFHLFPFKRIQNRKIFSQFLNQATLFAEGLTQEQENNPLTGGYDVSINCIHSNGQESRVMFLQYKAGTRKSYSKLKGSQFFREKGKTGEHVSFVINDAANRTQHSTLRNFAKSTGISQKSVMYVFPRITEQKDFKSKVGNLIHHTSFVPVVELDKQAENQTPKIIINDGVTHKYRTSYDGKLSEVNLLLLLLLYDATIVYEFLSELICIQIERFAKILYKEGNGVLGIFLETFSGNLSRFVDYELKESPLNYLVKESVASYLELIKEGIASESKIPYAPNNFTSIVPIEGLRIKLEGEINLFSLKYQLF